MGTVPDQKEKGCKPSTGQLSDVA